MTLTVRCPAKVNLFLAVGPPDDRGYHPLRTIFQAVGLYDILTISDETEHPAITSNWKFLPRDNTVSKTLRLCQELVNLPVLSIHIQKHIPTQSGLGGGSSDAAGLLRALPQFTGPWAWGHAEAVAQAVGADVSFFLMGGRARATGYGEDLSPLEDPSPQWLLIARPKVGVSTPEAYRILDSIPREWRDFPDNPDEYYNDFEAVAPTESIDLIADLTSYGAEAVALCGSGSAVFGRFATHHHATEAQSKIACKSWIVPTLTRKESLWIS